jgi:hypothetical protein
VKTLSKGRRRADDRAGRRRGRRARSRLPKSSE